MSPQIRQVQRVWGLGTISTVPVSITPTPVEFREGRRGNLRLTKCIEGSAASATD